MRFIFVLLLFIATLLARAEASSAGDGDAEQTTQSLYLVHFKTGGEWNKSLPPHEQTNFKEHSANLNDLRQAGQIKFGARYSEFGMIVLAAGSLAEAKALIQRDPGVVAGIFDFSVEELSIFYPWQ